MRLQRRLLSGETKPAIYIYSNQVGHVHTVNPATGSEDMMVFTCDENESVAQIHSAVGVEAEKHNYDLGLIMRQCIEYKLVGTLDGPTIPPTTFLIQDKDDGPTELDVMYLRWPKPPF